MEKEINPEDLDKMLEADGGIEGVMLQLEQGEKDNIFLESHQQEWKKQYPDKWIAVYKEELVAIAATTADLYRELEERDIPRNHTKVHFLSTKNIRWMLERKTNERRNQWPRLCGTTTN